MQPKGVVFDGKTLDEAVRKGMDALGLTRAEVIITVLEEGSGGFLGIGARPYRVRMMPRPARQLSERPAGREREGRGERGGRDGDRGRRTGRDAGGRGGRAEGRGGRGGRGETRATEGRGAGRGRPEARGDGRGRGPSRPDRPAGGGRPAQAAREAASRPAEERAAPREEMEARPAGERGEGRDRGRRRRRGRGGHDGERGPDRVERPAPPAEMAPGNAHETSALEERRPSPPRGDQGGNGMSSEELGQSASRATEELLRAMGFDATVTARVDGDTAEVKAEVPDQSDLLVGPKGEVRQALQHLLNRTINRGGGSRYHLQLEINDFWHQREDELRDMALRLAEEAVAEDAEKLTEYLNSQERRIVHMTLREHKKVTTHAIGEGLIKKIAITPADDSEGERSEA